MIGLNIMEGSLLGALLRGLEPVPRGGAPAEAAPDGYPGTMIARVVSLKGDRVLLQRPEGNFTAVLDAAVTPGENLLLEYAGLKQGRHHYRIAARFPAVPAGEPHAGNSAAPELSCWFPGATAGNPAAPVLLHCPYRRESRAGAPAGGETERVIFELFVETKHCGLIAVRFTQKGEQLGCHFLVESTAIGEALEREAARIAAVSSREVGTPLLRWSVIDVRQEAAALLRKGGLSLNARA